MVGGKAAADLVAYESIKRVARKVSVEIDRGGAGMHIMGQVPESVLEEIRALTAWSIACVRIAQFAKMN